MYSPFPPPAPVWTWIKSLFNSAGQAWLLLLPAPLDQLLKVGVKLGNIKEGREGWECLEWPEGTLRSWNCCGGEKREMDPSSKVSVSIPGVSHIPKASGGDPALSGSSERGWGPLFWDNSIPRSCCPPGSLPQNHGEQTWPKPEWEKLCLDGFQEG